MVHPPKPLQPNVDPQARTEIEQLKRTIKNLAEPKIALINDPFDDLPRIILPPNYPLDFRKYNGTTDPLHHIKTFKMKTPPYTEDSQMLAYLFQRSLEVDALEWYYTILSMMCKILQGCVTTFLRSMHIEWVTSQASPI